MNENTEKKQQFYQRNTTLTSKFPNIYIYGQKNLQTSNNHERLQNNKQRACKLVDKEPRVT